MLAVLLWIDACNEFGRGTSSACTFPDGPFSCPVISFSADDRAAENRVDRFCGGIFFLCHTCSLLCHLAHRGILLRRRTKQISDCSTHILGFF
jgi:hypothetical protein